MSDTHTAAQIEWLTSPAAADWLEIAAGWNGEPLALAALLRKDLPAERAALVIGQAELRRRAADKFVQAARMFFTRRGLEQASDDVVARYKAGRLEAVTSDGVADLCCGIGGDLMAIAARGRATGVERDPATAAAARANLRVAKEYIAGKPVDNGTQVMTADVRSFPVSGQAAWHIDPDRRREGRRTTRVVLHEPGPDVIARLLAECPTGAIKLAPAADIRSMDVLACDVANGIEWGQAELEWIGRKRQCRQLVAWFGSLAEYPGRRRATVLANDLAAEGQGLVVASYAGLPSDAAPVAPTMGRYVFEPDTAVLAAGLGEALAIEMALQKVAGDVAYLTGDEPRASPLLSAFEVQEVMPYGVKKVKAWLGIRRIGRLEVKKRGVDLDPARVQRELRVAGDEQATMLLCRVSGSVVAILARRVR